MKRRQKDKGQTRHVKKRCLERLGFPMHQHLACSIIKAIQNQKGRFVRRCGINKSVWELEIESQTVRVVYDKKSKSIITCYLALQEESV